MPQYNGSSSNVESHNVTNDGRPLTAADVRALRELLGTSVVDTSAEMPSPWQEFNADDPWVDENRKGLDSALQLGSDLEPWGLPTFVGALPPSDLHSLSGAQPLFAMVHHYQVLRDLPPVFELQSGGRQRESRLAFERVELGLLATAGSLGAGVAQGFAMPDEDRLELTLESTEVPLASADAIPKMVSASGTDEADAAPSTRQTTTALGLGGTIVTNQFESPVGAVLQGLPSDEKAQVALPHERGAAGPDSPSGVADQPPSAAADISEIPSSAEPMLPTADGEASLEAPSVEAPADAATLIEPPVDVAVPIDPPDEEPPAEDAEPSETPAVTPAPLNPPPDDPAAPDPIPLPSKPAWPPTDPPTDPKPIDLPSPAPLKSVGPLSNEPAAVPTTASAESHIPPEQHAAESSLDPSSVEEPPAGYGRAEEDGANEAWAELLQTGVGQPTVDDESVVQTNDPEGVPWSVESSLRDLLIHPVDYALPAEPIVEYSAPGLGVDAATAEALMTLLGASVPADLAELSAAFAERDEHEGPQLEALPEDAVAGVPLLEELPYDSAAGDQQDLRHYDLPDLTPPNEIIDH